MGTLRPVIGGWGSWFESLARASCPKLQTVHDCTCVDGCMLCVCV